MFNWRKSKLGFTLVELVVTVGILSIVSGMGIGIVASAIKNYGTASTTSKEQDTSLLVERFIVEGIRSGKKVLSWDSPSALSTTESARYLYFEDGKLVTVNSYVEAGKAPTKIVLTYEGVKSVSLTVKKSKPKMGGETDPGCFLFVSYVIEMNWGYTLSGSTVMNNADIKKYAMDNIQSMEYTNVNYTLWIGEDEDISATTIQDPASEGNVKCTALMIQQ